MALARYVLLPVVLFILWACTAGTDAEKDAAAAVSRYHGMLRRAYLEANPGLLRSVATENQIRKIVPTIEAMRLMQSSMISEVEQFKIEKAVVRGEQATVVTQEHWVYWWQHVATGQITKPREAAAYHLRYHLKKIEGVWLVDQIETEQ